MPGMFVEKEMVKVEEKGVVGGIYGGSDGET